MKTDVSASFFQRVYGVVEQIPRGRVTTYGAIASYLGSRGSSRMVGWAMNHCHHTHPNLPAHRVVNRQGHLTGKMHFGGSHVMQQLLENEGIVVENDKIKNFRERFWDPATQMPGVDFF